VLLVRCGLKDCVHFCQGHPVCAECWRSKELRDHYRPRLPYYEQGRVVNLLGRAWEEYCLSGLSKRHAVAILAYIQRAQELVMAERVNRDEEA
jgi:hypothetical protein